uniref:Fibronectin type-III domain-containing protein n=1 Tax=Astyanax mexicanus TaxID=7994 RepID=A0A8B9GT08_ASTMX
MTKNAILFFFFISSTVRPINPHNLTLEVVNRSYHFKWVSGYEEHTYESSLPRLYKFFYHKEQQDTVSLVNKLLFLKTECSIPEHDLEAGIRYVSWVCTEISNQNNDYKGVGSSCSSPITWSTTPTGKYRDNFNTAVINRIKKVTWVATPSPFFQPLFHNHQGNFKVRMALFKSILNRKLTCEASLSQTAHSKIFLQSCASGPPTPFSALVRASLCHSSNRVVNSMVRYF